MRKVLSQKTETKIFRKKKIRRKLRSAERKLQNKPLFIFSETQEKGFNLKTRTECSKKGILRRLSQCS